MFRRRAAAALIRIKNAGLRGEPPGLTHIKGAQPLLCERGPMPDISASLAGHHRHLEELLGEAVIAARSANWAVYKTRFAAFRSGLMEHIAYEEREFFPQLAGRDAAAAAAVEALRAEHARLRRHFETLSAAAPEHDPEGCLAEIEELAGLMREHCTAEMALDPQYDARAAPPLSPLEVPTLDLRGLQPPEPIVRIFEALERAPREPLRAILPHEPVPLYALLRERGFSYSGSPRPDGGFEVLIERPG
jgi:hypothetical protein